MRDADQEDHRHHHPDLPDRDRHHHRQDRQPSVSAVIEQIAPRLRHARKKKGISLADLARATGISTSTLSPLTQAVFMRRSCAP
jgi:ribosome-binding protein aMBF1 (putative translation factor)